MMTPEEWREDAKTAREKCFDGFRDRIDILESENMALRDKRDELQEDIERVSRERDEAKEKYVELIEIVGRGNDQTAGSKA